MSKFVEPGGGNHKIKFIGFYSAIYYYCVSSIVSPKIVSPRHFEKDWKLTKIETQIY